MFYSRRTRVFDARLVDASTQGAAFGAPCVSCVFALWCMQYAVLRTFWHQGVCFCSLVLTAPKEVTFEFIPKLTDSSLECLDICWSFVYMFHAIWKPLTVCRLHRAVCRLHGGRAVCRLRGHRFNELRARVCFGEITSKKTDRIVMIL